MTEQTEADRQAAEAAEAQERRNAIIQPLIQSITQKEKFLLSDRLSKPYSELMQDPDRVMIALAWKKLKNENGGVAPSWEQLLDKTDAEILDVLGLADEDDDEAVREAGEG